MIETRDDAEAIALKALAYVVSDETLGGRFITLSGLQAADLYARAGSVEVLAATLDFLAANEADLVTCAAAIGASAAMLARARRLLA